MSKSSTSLQLEKSIQNEIRILEAIPHNEVSRQLIISNLKSILVKNEEEKMKSLQNVNPGPGQVAFIDSPETQVFHNRLIVLQICKYLPQTHLYKYRSINQTFYETWLILGQDTDNNIEFKFNSSTNHYENPQGTLDDLSKILKTTTQFPITNFTFTKGHLHTRDIENFLLHGKVHKLKLNLTCQPHQVYHAIHFLRKFLLTVSQDLQYLNLDSLTFPDLHKTNCQLFPDPVGSIKLIKLKTFKIGYLMPQENDYKNLIKDILNIAVNLEVIKHFGMYWNDDLITLNKIHTVKSFDVNLNGSFVDSYERWAPAVSNLKEVKFNLIRVSEAQLLWPRIVSILNNLFEANKLTLESIELLDELVFLPDLRLPILDKVKTIKFGHRMHPRYHRLLPRDILFSRSFPNLTSIELYCKGGFIWENIGLDYLTSVKYLNINSNCSLQCMSQIAPLFPNCQQFDCRISNFSECPAILRGCWSWFIYLEQICIVIDDCEREEEFCAKMDSAITGISQIVCQQLRDNSRHVQVNEVANLRSEPSIFDAKYLQKFKLQVTEGTSQRDPVLSHVAGIYGFEPMRLNSGLKVILESVMHSSTRDQVGYQTFGLVTPYVDCIDV